jgi:acetate kinase
MKVLICNAGSTSLKFKLYEMPQAEILAQCKIERVGSSDDALFYYLNNLTGAEIKKANQSIPNYLVGIQMFIEHLTTGSAAALSDISEVERVGYKATLSKGYFGIHEITDSVIQGMRDWLCIAKLHNTAYLETIQAMRELLPDSIFIGAFETSLHQNIPLERKLFALPYEWYEKYGVQRLGYHSASHGYIADVLGRDRSKYKAISCHLGGSCSICALEDGKSVNTSFGMSLQSGVLHANRVGDMDGDLFLFLKNEGLSEEEIIDGMYNNGGLYGISGVSNDLRYIEEAAGQGNERAKLAIDMFVQSIVRYIGSFYLDLNGLDYLVFTGGIGENSSLIRKLVCDKLKILGVELDSEANQTKKGELSVLSTEKSSASVMLIPTDEELGIARRAYEFSR